MQKNEKHIYKKINLMKTSYKNLYNKISNNNTFYKSYSPQNITLKKNQTSSNFILYKMNSFNNNENSNKKENKKISTNDLNLLFSKRNNFINTINMDENYLRLISSKNIKNKRVSSILYNLKNKSYFIQKRTDLIKTKFLLGKKNYYKRLFYIKNEGITSIDKNYSPLLQLNINYNIYNDNIKSFRKTKNNFSFPFINKKQEKKFISIKIKKNNIKNIDNVEGDDLLDKYIKHNNNIFFKRNNNNLIIENKKFNSENILIEDNYNEYLNDISSDSNKNKYEINILKNKIDNSIYDKKDINIKPKEIKIYKLKKYILKGNNQQNNNSNKNEILYNSILKQKVYCK